MKVGPFDARRLEEALLNATAPPEQLLYDGWLLRLSREHIKRASSVNATFPSSLPTPDKIEACERAYRGRGLVPIFRITSMQDAGLDRELDARGYRVFEPSLVQAVSLDAPAAPPILPCAPRFESMDLGPWVAMVGRLRDWPAHDVEAHTRRMDSSVLASRCLSLLLGDAVASCGLVTLEGEYAGLFDIYTPPEYRGKGLATALCARLLQVGRENGATIGWLSVLAANEAALAVYRRLGFVPVYEYWYRVPEDY